MSEFGHLILIGIDSLCNSDCTGEVKAVPLLLTVFGGVLWLLNWFA